MRRRKDVAANAIEDTSDNPEVVATKKDAGEVLRECLGGVSPEHRKIVVDLVCYDEKSVEEVAEIIGKHSEDAPAQELAELLKAAAWNGGWPWLH